MNLFKPIHDYLYQLKKFVLSRNKLVRSIQTKNYSTKKVAIGESNDYNFPKDWITIDQYHADFIVDLNSNYTLPFQDNSLDAVYTAHTFEHLTPEKAEHALREVFRVLKSTGKFRIEVPDVEKIMKAYVNKSEEYIKHFDVFHNPLITNFNYPEKYREVQLGLMGTVSNYIPNPPFFQIPVYATKEECDQKIKDLDLDDFCEWCLSLQTPDQYKTAGHKTYFYPAKMKRMLESVGFKNVNNVDFNITSYAEFKLNKGEGSIAEKPHRIFFSMYMEAEK